MQCQRLDMNGKRCKRKAVYIEHYHGDHEIYGNEFDNKKEVKWVEIYLCGVHRQTDKDSENYIGKIKRDE